LYLQVKFIFSSGIGAALCKKLEALGLKVEGERIPDEELAVHPRLKPYKDLLCESSDSNSEEGKSNEQSGEDCVDGVVNGDGQGSESTPNTGQGYPPKPAAVASPHIRNPSLEGITKLNLDITALIAYCSNLTNGHTNVQFRSKILSQQLDFERMRPQKPILEAVFRGTPSFNFSRFIYKFSLMLNPPITMSRLCFQLKFQGVSCTVARWHSRSSIQFWRLWVDYRSNGEPLSFCIGSKWSRIKFPRDPVRSRLLGVSSCGQ